MHLTDAPYASTVSGYVITALLAIIGVGYGYIFRSLGNDLKDVSKNLEKLEERQGKSETNVAVLLDRDVQRHGEQNRT